MSQAIDTLPWRACHLKLAGLSHQRHTGKATVLDPEAEYSC